MIAKKNRGLNSSFTVRKISNGEGVERVFQTHSKLITEIKVKRKGDVEERSSISFVKEVVNLPELKKRSNQLTKKYWAIFLLTLSIVFSNIAYSIDADIKLPDGFQIELYTDQVPGARSLAHGDNYLFISSMEEGNLYAIDIDGL